MSKNVLRTMRWVALAACVSVPHALPVAYHWPAALLAVLVAACLDFASTRGGA
jgi:hypothetical protein